MEYPKKCGKHSEADLAAMNKSSYELLPWRGSPTDLATDILGLGREHAESILQALAEKLGKRS